jgi:hypothetical protein
MDTRRSAILVSWSCRGWCRCRRTRCGEPQRIIPRLRLLADESLGFLVECRALVQRCRQRFGLDHPRIDQFAAGRDTLDLPEAEAFEFALAHLNCPFRREPECFERGAAELQRRFEGLPHLINHALGEQFEAVARSKERT